MTGSGQVRRGNPLRVALVGPGFPPQRGGVEHVLYRHATGLTDRGCTVEVLAQWRPRHDPPVPRQSQIRTGLTVRWFTSRTRSRRFPVAPGLASFLRRNAGRYDLVHGHSFHGFAATMAALSTDLPFVYSPHYHGVGHTALASGMHRLYGPLGRRVVRRAQAIMCVSRTEAERLCADFDLEESAVHLVPNGVDADEIQAARPFSTSNPVVLVVGRLEAYKQVDVVIRAMAHLPDCTLVVIGTGPHAGMLRESASSVCSAHIEFLGTVSDQDLRRWQRTAIVLVSLSRHEAFGLVPLEGLAAGSWVIASDIPAHRELANLGPSAIRLLSVEASASELATAIRSCLMSPPPPPPPGLPTWSEAADGCLEIYRAVIGTATPEGKTQ